ncbi:DNA recombination protein RmuC [Phreatobacter sp. AB_2022a]|uniref:DNA recombination protein RmuC n=1 Tax=Phreatobacter sp. AB_2022a TaxID=3003134 RepID=UPI00228733E2|nr:DNA recombination protein RmuC [Phreatobacter sp. AB_2022a]MCZ0737540.1 DNA recombination protein RmuC [Phreatobacter sp. AB_2022a]
MSDTLLVIGDRPVSSGEVVLALLGLAVFLLVVLFAAMRRQAAARAIEAERAVLHAQELEERMGEMNRVQAELTGRLQAMAEGLQARQFDLTKALGERLDGLSVRLGQSLEGQTRTTVENLGRLNERLAVIDSAQKNLTDLAGQVVSLKDVLANKQARGAFGQGRMEAILKDALPRNGYELQPTLSTGKRPDAVIRIAGDPRGLVVDAKFPLEAVTLWREAKAEEVRRMAAQRLRQDFAVHVKDIAEKYLLPGETQDLALLFVPSEGIYADLNEHFDDVVQKAFRARVMVVSPSLLMLAVQVVQGLLKDERMRDEARVIQKEVGLLLDDVSRLSDRVLNLQRHFGQAHDDLGQILTSADKIAKRGSRIEALEFDEAPSAPAGLAKLPLKGSQAAE